MVDDSLKRRNSNIILARIGGFILDNSGNKIFHFSGPVDLKEALKAESRAMEFILEVLIASHYRGISIGLCSDSTTDIDYIKKKILKGKWEFLILYLHYIPRKYNGKQKA